MKLNLKERKGITLIALVITIIVLLILAGISIATLTGQNGILTQAQNAKTTTENKSAEEKVKLAIMAARADDGTLTVEKLRTELAKYEGTVEGNTFSVTAKVDGKTFTVDEKGNVELEGSESVKIKPGTVVSLTSTKGTTEEFYVLSYDERTQKAKALAKYNLLVGGIYDGTGTIKTGDVDKNAFEYGLQEKSMKGYINGKGSKGAVEFSSSRYWSDTEKYPSQTSEHTSSHPWVYDKDEEKCTISKYVESYKTLLGNTDKVSEVSLASYEDINALLPDKSDYTWLYSTSYWLGSAYSSSDSNLWLMYEGRLLLLQRLLPCRLLWGSPSYNCQYVENLKRL